jgi:hypothetical protein
MAAHRQRRADGEMTDCVELPVQLAPKGSQGAPDYQHLVKRGDAVETPDGNVWMVQVPTRDACQLVLAERDADGTIRVPMFNQVVTTVPVEYLTKVADATEVGCSR